jgi:nucleoid-associated protein YgaU
MRTVKQRYHRNRITFFISASALAFILADSASSQFSGLAEEELQQQGTGQYWETEKTSPDGTRGGQHRHGGPAAGRKYSGEEGTTYQRIIVQPGDTLYKIARRVYGDAGRWHLIYDANRDKLEDPNQVPAGVELIVPAQ